MEALIAVVIGLCIRFLPVCRVSAVKLFIKAMIRG